METHPFPDLPEATTPISHSVIFGSGASAPSARLACTSTIACMEVWGLTEDDSRMAVSPMATLLMLISQCSITSPIGNCQAKLTLPSVDKRS